ncbi:MAG TPA: class I SAM-dependent methyltransferase [Mesorhizobium sp.]|jgi:SAM-dependent methyltransferase|uniref:class I SAM-dependent methyltransferase n=1 Tax=Mesorhizobium sp. TaxID=1871066 RepID=UPI002DDCF569|nr:class I SAM-dependent methyltransferase [Mesorhizobium sp.]HEV2506538.1 class I SAM-dependent methyltransferase [Mesorhizobium sp.]
MKVPERLGWTIERLGIVGNETILEIGGGRGMAAALVLSKLKTGRLVGIDRSDTAIEAARVLNEVDERAGRLRLIQASIETFDAGADRFDIAFVINVNLFWIDADPALKNIRGLLKPDGRLVLAYEPPSASRIESIIARLCNNLQIAGWQIQRTEAAEHAPLLLMVAIPLSQTSPTMA